MTIVSPHTGAPVPQTKEINPGDYRPSPGRVLLARQTVEDSFVDDGEIRIIKAEITKEQEATWEAPSTVIAVGETIPGGIKPWFSRGAIVEVEPSFMMRPRQLTPTLTVFNVPFAAIIGVLADGDAE